MTSVTMATASPSQRVVGAHKAARINFSFALGAVDFNAVVDGQKAPAQWRSPLRLYAELLSTDQPSVNTATLKWQKLGAYTTFNFLNTQSNAHATCATFNIEAEGRNVSRTILQQRQRMMFLKQPGQARNQLIALAIKSSRALRNKIGFQRLMTLSDHSNTKRVAKNNFSNSSAWQSFNVNWSHTQK